MQVQSNHHINLEIHSAYHQTSTFLKEGCNKVTHYYSTHKTQIDYYMPLAAKYTYYGLVLFSFASALAITGTTSIAGYVLADRVKKIQVIGENGWNSLMASKQYSEEDKMWVKIIILSAGIASVCFLPWWMIAIPIGMSVGAFVRNNL